VSDGAIVFRPCLRARLRRHYVKAARLTVSFPSIEAVVQDLKPNGTGHKARARKGLVLT